MVFTRFRAFYTNTLLVVASSLLALGAVELSSRAYLIFFPTLNFQSHIEFRKSRPPPYKDSDYDISSFTDESFSPHGWLTPPNSRLVIPNDFNGRYINVENGLRKTTHQPSKFSNVIYIFGGSTVFCNEVPDWYTLPSILQGLVNENYPNQYKVENYGATTVVSAQELERLKTVSLQHGDVVVFYNGANDSFISIYKNNPKGWIIGENRKILFDKGFFATSLVKLHSRYGRFSKFVDFFLSPYDYRFEPIHLKKQSQVEVLASKMRTHYLENILSAHHYSIGAGSKFFLFLQPTLVTSKNSSRYEYQIRHNAYLIPNGMEKAVKAGYKELRPTVRKLYDKHGVFTFDISDLFDKRPQGDEYFLDWVHVSEKGNAKIANAIFSAIKPSLQR